MLDYNLTSFTGSSGRIGHTHARELARVSKNQFIKSKTQAKSRNSQNYYLDIPDLAPNNRKEFRKLLEHFKSERILNKASNILKCITDFIIGK